MRLLYILLFALMTGRAVAGENILIVYQSHPPFLTIKDGKPSGAGYELTNKIFVKADTNPIWTYMPWVKQRAYGKSSERRVCLTYIMKTKRRARVMKFTDALGDGGAQYVLGKKGNKRLLEASSLDRLMNNPNLVVILKSGFSYGKKIEQLLETGIPTLEITNGNYSSIFDVINAGLSDYTIIDKQVKAVVESNPTLAESLQVYHHITGMPQSSPFYIACSPAVEDALIVRLNDVINSNK